MLTSGDTAVDNSAHDRGGRRPPLGRGPSDARAWPPPSRPGPSSPPSKARLPAIHPDPVLRAWLPALPASTVPGDPVASPLDRPVQDRFETLAAVHEKRFEPTLGPLRPVVRDVVEKFLDCGLLESGFARVRCGSCRAEFLVAFSCKCRYFCPSCHAKRLTLWSEWLETDHLVSLASKIRVFLTL